MSKKIIKWAEIKEASDCETEKSDGCRNHTSQNKRNAMKEQRKTQQIDSSGGTQMEAKKQMDPQRKGLKEIGANSTNKISEQNSLYILKLIKRKQKV